MAAIMADEEEGVKMDEDDQLIKLKESLSLHRRAAASGKLLCFKEGCCPSEICNENIFFKNISGLQNHLQRTHKMDFKCTTDQDLRLIFFPSHSSHDQTSQ